MKNIKFIVSYDIQDNKGKSLLQKDIANAIVLPMAEDDFNNFIYGLARLRLETFAGHLYTCCLQANKKTLGKDALVSNYNYVLEFPRNLSANWDYQHSRVVTLGTGDPYITLKEDAVKSRAFGLFDEYDANNLNSPAPTIRQILGLDP